MSALTTLSDRAITPPTADQVQKSITPDGSITTFTLPNGLNIVTKHNSSEEGILLRIMAPGGSFAFPTEKSTAAKYAGTFALQSGMNHLSVFDLDQLFFDYSIDVALRTRPFHRLIDLRTSKESSPIALAFLHHFFLDMKPDASGIFSTVERIEDAIVNRTNDYNTRFEDNYLSINSGGHHSMLPTKQEQVRSIAEPIVEEVFPKMFRNISDFTLIAVGDFSEDLFFKDILYYLGSIPLQHPPFPVTPPPKLIFPRGHLQRTVFCTESIESLIRITFPVRIEITEKNYPLFEFATQVLEQLLRQSITKQYGLSHAIDVQYHLPVYPYISTVWLTVQYRCPKEKIEDIKKLVLSTIQDLQKNGASKKVIEKIQIHFSQTNDFWLQQDDFWLPMLTNFIFWKWPLENIVKDTKQQTKIKGKEVKKIIEKSLSTEDYTILILESC